MSFLPEDDQDYLAAKELKFELLTEDLGAGNTRRAVVFPAYTFEGNLHVVQNNCLVRCSSSDLMVLIPAGYSTTKLDSFYTALHLKRPDGSDPNCAASDQSLFGRNWQFWSRHLDNSEWRNGVDGLETFLQYIRGELRKA